MSSRIPNGSGESSRSALERVLLEHFTGQLDASSLTMFADSTEHRPFCIPGVPDLVHRQGLSDRLWPRTLRGNSAVAFAERSTVIIPFLSRFTERRR